MIVVLPSLPVKNLQDLVKLARARPGEVLYASSGPGSAMHLAGALFGVVTKTQLTHVPYKGGPATATAVLGGEATTAFNTIETVLPLIRAKRLRARGVDTRARAGAARRADCDGSGGQGLRSDRLVRAARAGRHAAGDRRAVERRDRKAMSTPALRERAAQEGATPIGSTPAEFDRFVRAEITKWTRIIKEAGITLE